MCKQADISLNTMPMRQLHAMRDIVHSVLCQNSKYISVVRFLHHGISLAVGPVAAVMQKTLTLA